MSAPSRTFEIVHLVVDNDVERSVVQAASYATNLDCDLIEFRDAAGVVVFAVPVKSVRYIDASAKEAS